MTLTGRYHSLFKISGTESFRLACSKLLGFYGGNAQNPTPSFMRCVIPEDGHVFVQPDQSGAEALIVAMECRPGKYRKLFDLNIKVHSYMALQLFTEKFKGEHPVSRYKGVEPEVLATYPELKSLLDTIKHSDDEYFLGKKTIHCLVPGHEVLTKHGWTPVENVNEADEIAVWNLQDHSIFFETPIRWNKGDYEGWTHIYDYPQLFQQVTPKHRLPIKSGYVEWGEDSSTTRMYKHLCVANNGLFIGGVVSPRPAVVKLIVALQADGHIESKNTAIFRLKREHKIDRLIHLCNEVGVVWHKKTYDGVTVIRVTDFYCAIKYFLDKKQWGSWLLNWDATSLDILLDELSYWDGGYYHYDYMSSPIEQYFTAIKENAEWIKTILHLRGRQGSLSKAGQIYRVGFNKRCYAAIKGSDRAFYKGPVYCPTTSTGFFMVRCEGKISVTGNSYNYNEGPQTFRLVCAVESDGKIALTFKQSKDFHATWQDTFPEIIEWQAMTLGRLGIDRYLRNLFGFPRYFGRLWNEELERQAYAFVPQSTVATITNIAYAELFHRIQKEHLPWMLLNQKHDSLLLDVPDTVEHRDMAASYCKQHMGRLLKSSRGEEYHMKVGMSFGYNWAKKTKDNPDGMEEQ